MMDIDRLHRECIYPAVRVRTKKAGGSGTVIYSKVNKFGDFDTFILTCHHVIDDAITIRDEWDAVLKRKSKKEFTEQVVVEIFDYVKTSTLNSANSYMADIVAYDKNHDMAILKLDSPKQVFHVARLIAQSAYENMFMGTPVIVVGCSLLHDPLVSWGKITNVKEIIDNKQYLMTSADAIFGNSGGSFYLEETGELIGIPSRVTLTANGGYGYDIITWMSFASHPKRLYEFLEEQELRFIYDEKDTYADAMKRRAKRQKKSILREAIEMEDDEPRKPEFREDLQDGPEPPRD